MKYRDNGFMKYQDKQRNGEVYNGYSSFKSERQIKRERQHRHYKFYNRFLVKNIDKYWWSNLKEVDKDEIISLFDMQLDFIEKDRNPDLWYSGPVFDTFDEWFFYIKETFKPNMSNLRQDKLKVLGI